MDEAKAERFHVQVVVATKLLLPKSMDSPVEILFGMMAGESEVARLMLDFNVNAADRDSAIATGGVVLRSLMRDGVQFKIAGATAKPAPKVETPAAELESDP